MEPKRTGGLVPTRDYFAALTALEDAYSPKNVHDMPHARRAEFERLVAGLRQIANDPEHTEFRENVPRISVNAALGIFRHKGFIETSLGMDAERVQRHIEDLPLIHVKRRRPRSDWGTLDQGTLRPTSQGVVATSKGPIDLRTLWRNLRLVQADPSAILEVEEGGGEPLEGGLPAQEVDLSGLDPELLAFAMTIEGGAQPQVAPRAIPSHFPDTNADGVLLIQATEAGTKKTVEIESDIILKKEIASGGSSDVFLALQGGRQVAVKIVKGETSPEMIEALRIAFENEVRFLEDLRGLEKVAIVHRFGVTSSGRPFIVMEVLPGGTLEDWITEVAEGEREFKLEEAVQLATDVVAAAAEVHGRNIVHRDIKPANYLFAGEGEGLKLADFGLAKRPGKDIDPQGVFCGTPGYIPAECLRVRTGTEDPEKETRDVYALGVVLYQILTGEHPLLKDPYRVMQEFIPKTMSAAMSGDLVPPSRLRPDRGIPPALERIVMKALEGNPAKRYPTAKEMLFDLLTYKAIDHEEKARGSLKIINEIIDKKGSDEDMRPHLREREKELHQAAEEYRKAHKLFPTQEVRDRLVGVLIQLFRRAIELGHDETRAGLVKEIRDLDPDNEEVNRKITLSFQLDRESRFLQAFYKKVMGYEMKVKYTIVRFDDDNGRLEPDESFNKAGHMVFDSLPPVLHLEPWSSYGLLVTGELIKSVFIPLPYAQGISAVRIPLFDAVDVAVDSTVVPGGAVAVRRRGGTLSQPHQETRLVEDDQEVRSSPTREEYQAYLDREKKKHSWLTRWWHLRKRRPKDWSPRSTIHKIIDRNGRVLDKKAPAAGMTMRSAECFAAEMYPEWEMIPFEVRRLAIRGGGDTRTWPWGDAPPDSGETMIMGCSVLWNPGPRDALPNDHPTVRDISPYSPPLTEEHVGRHSLGKLVGVAGNGRIFVPWPDSIEGRRRILGALELKQYEADDPELPDKVVLFTGVAHNEPAPTCPDHIYYAEGKKMRDRFQSGVVGFMLRRKLRSGVLPTPSTEKGQNVSYQTSALDVKELLGG